MGLYLLRLKYGFYFIFIIASGLVYSYTTTEVARSVLENKLIILALSAIIEMLIFFDLKKVNIISHIRLRSFFYIGFISCILIFTFSFFVNNVYIYVLFYFCINIVISIIILIFENEILNDEINLKDGFINLASVRNLSKIVGFGVGAILSFLSNYYFIFLTVLIFITALILISDKAILRKNEVEIELDNANFREIKSKEYFIILGILSTTTTIWIPIFVNDFIKEGIGKISFIPFILPGIFIFIILELVKREKLNLVLNNATSIYLILSVIFMIYISNLGNVFLGILIFSLLTSVGILVSIELRRKFLLSNKNMDSKFILQSLYLNGSFFLLIFSSVYKYMEMLQFVIITFNILSMLYLLQENYKAKLVGLDNK